MLRVISQSPTDLMPVLDAIARDGAMRLFVGSDMTMFHVSMVGCST